MLVSIPSDKLATRQPMRKADAHSKMLVHHHDAGLMLHQHHNLMGALTAMNSAIQLQPQSPALFKDRGLLYRQLGRWADAIADYNHARILEERALKRALASRPRSAGGRLPPGMLARAPSNPKVIDEAAASGAAVAAPSQERLEEEEEEVPPPSEQPMQLQPQQPLQPQPRCLCRRRRPRPTPRPGR